MIAKSRTSIIRLLLSLLILSGLGASLYSQDKNLSNVINIYKHVELIGADNVTLTDVTGLLEGDTVLIIQITGAAIRVDNTNTFGTQTGYFGEPGMSEFLIISNISGSTVTFTSLLANNYSADEVVQLIRVPYYNSATVTATLTCQPWDSVTKTGGVLALIVGGSLSLNADIDVSGKGFLGGDISSGTGECASVSGMNDYFYDHSFVNSGIKGEGAAHRAYLNPLYPPLFPGYAKGKGANFSGGGGGNGKYSGGGGGANWGDGGKGGTDGCSLPYGGVGGLKIKLSDIDLDFDNNIFMGGGGGGSTHENVGTPSSPGAKGGGIVIIICDTLKGNGRIISAEGGSPGLVVTGNAGAGGGGGGGSVALYLQSYSSGSSSALTVSVNGGKGGNTGNIYGEGGGGGGGLILTNSISKPANVLKTYSGGAVGRAGGGGSNGSPGDSINTFLPNLNGFLYNSIRSSVSGDQTDSICSNMPSGVIAGTIPFSGTIQWQSTTVANPVDADFTNITGATSKDYTPGLLTQTTWFRRVVTETGPPLIIDKSKPVKIIVQPFIENNETGNPDTVCFGQNPKMLISIATLAGGSPTDIYRFKWSVSTDNTVFTDTVDNNTAEEYTPEPELTMTSWYKRTVTSGRCVDSSAIVRIFVLDTINNNKILSLPQDICFGTTFTDLTATTPSTTPALAGGDETFRYLWISSINGSSWGPAPGVNNTAGYNPAELAERDPSNEYKFMRIIKSGSQDACVDTTSVLLLKDYPVLTNNSIVTAVQKICSGSVPAVLSGTDPLKGNGTYTYIWQDSSKSRPAWTDITEATGRDYLPPALTDTTSYRRKVSSSACSDVSKSVRINVNKIIANNIISLVSGGIDTTSCDGANPNRFTGTLPSGGTNLAGDYAYEWLLSVDNSTWSPVTTGGTGQGYDPPALNATTYYKRKVLSGACIDISASTITVTVLPLISNNILSDPPVICKDYIPAPITGNTPGGGDGIYKYLWLQSSDNGASWLPAAGTNNDPSGNYQPPALSIDMKYRRVVNSGNLDCCRDTSGFIDLLIHKLPSSPVYAGPDTTIYSPDGYYIMRASPIDLTYETGLWTGDGKILTPTDNHTEVELNSTISPNKFLWTVTNGPCINKASVSISFFNVEVPNGFSPNGDGMNDVFEVRGLEIEFQTVELSIINSAGTEVFHTTNKNNEQWYDWDGKNSKGVDLPEGTYYYILMIDPDKTEGSPTKKSGFIVLKRR